MLLYSQPQVTPFSMVWFMFSPFKVKLIKFFAY